MELNKKIESEIRERRNLAESLEKLQEEMNTLKVENAELKARPIKTYMLKSLEVFWQRGGERKMSY